MIRAHACPSGYVKGGNTEHSLGRRKGGFTTKIHALVDALGNRLSFILTPGNHHESTQAPALLESIKNANVIGDKAFDNNQLIAQIENKTASLSSRHAKTANIKGSTITILIKRVTSLSASLETLSIFAEPSRVSIKNPPMQDSSLSPQLSFGSDEKSTEPSIDTQAKDSGN